MSAISELLMPGTAGDDTDEHWMERSSCSRTDPDAFFKDAGENSTWEKKVCARCPVQVLCLGLALELEGPSATIAWGVWGSLDASERRALTPAQRLAAIRAARNVRRNGIQDEAA